MSTLAHEVLLKKQRLRGRLDYATAQVDLLEQMLRSGASIDKRKYESVRAEFIVAMPSSHETSGCSKSCDMYCKCSSHLFGSEISERYELYLRYLTAKEAVKKFISKTEQTSFALPAAIRRSETAHKRMPSKPKVLEQEVRQLGIVF